MKLGTSLIILSFMQNLYIGEFRLFVFSVHASFKCKIHIPRHRTGPKSLWRRIFFFFLLSWSVRLLLFLQFSDVKLSFLPNLKDVFSKVKYCFWEEKMKGKPSKQFNLLFTKMVSFFHSKDQYEMVTCWSAFYLC